MSLPMKTSKIAVMGLGYVGLPLAVEFGKSSMAPIIGFDIDESKIQELKSSIDRNKELDSAELRQARIEYTSDPAKLQQADFIIIAIPTPITDASIPDLSYITSASTLVGKNLSKGTIVVFESTVYPGVTEDICVPIIEKESDLECGKDWKIAYSPERINPGDKEHTLAKTIKIVSGMDKETLDEISDVYALVCKAGVHKAANIKTAEAAKVIENIQRDLNIALINELALIFHRLGINTHDVLEAAGTKWNFHRYSPGLVGGHCIGVDPYYLTYRAQELGYHPEVILAGRRINDWIPEYVGDLMIQGLIEAGKVVQDARVLVLGLTFKEDIRDMRNSKIKDTIRRLQSFGIHVLGHDPHLYKTEVESFGIDYVEKLSEVEGIDGIILATPHKELKKLMLSDFLKHYNDRGDGRGVFIDIKSLFLNSWRERSFGNIIYKCL